MLRGAFVAGSRAALAKFASAMGANAGVMPTGDEVSHGTELLPYPKRDGASPDLASAARGDMPDWLWDNFTTYDNVAPGRADGTWGQEVIG